MSASAELAAPHTLGASSWQGFASLTCKSGGPYDIYSALEAGQAGFAARKRDEIAAKLGALVERLEALSDDKGILQLFARWRLRMALPATKLGAAHAGLLTRIAAAALRCGQAEEAERLLSAILRRRPAHLPAHVLMAQLLRSKDPALALRQLCEARALPSFAAHPAAVLSYLELLREQGQPGLARAEILRWHSPDSAGELLLAMANLERSTSDKMVFLRAWFEAQGLAPLALRSGAPLLALSDLLPPVLPKAGEGPLVSVVMASRNAAPCLAQAVLRLQAQSHTRWELLIADDASEDGSQAVLAALAQQDGRIRPILLETTIGLQAARNRAMLDSRGDFVALQNVESFAHPQRLEQQVRALHARPAQLAVWSRGLLLDPAGALCPGPEGLFAQGLEDSLMFRREPVMRSIGFFDSVLYGAEEEFRLRMQARHGGASVGLLEETLGLAPAKALTSELTTALQTYRSAWLDWHATQRHRPIGLYRSHAPLERPFAAPASLLRGDLPLKATPQLSPLARMALPTGGGVAAADVLHVLDLRANNLLALTMLHQAAIELANGHAVQVWNILELAEEGFGWYARSLHALRPEAFVTAPVGLPRLAFVYGVEALEEMSRRGAEAPARRLIVLVQSTAEQSSAQQRLDALGWPGAVYTVNGRLFPGLNRPEVPVWDVALSAVLFDEPVPVRLGIGLSYLRRSPSDAELEFIARMRQATRLPVVVLAETADQPRLAAVGAETVSFSRYGTHWSVFFARASLLLEQEGNLSEATVNDAPGQALRRARPVVMLAGEAAVSGAVCFPTETTLFSWLAALDGDPVRYREALVAAMAAFSASLGEEYHLRRLEGLLDAAGPPPVRPVAPLVEPISVKPGLVDLGVVPNASAAPSLVKPPARKRAIVMPSMQAGPAATMGFLAQASGGQLVAWLAKGPDLQTFRRALQLLESRHRMIATVRLYDRVAAHADKHALIDPALMFWLRLQAAYAFSAINWRNSAQHLLAELEASPLRAGFGPEDAIRFGRRRAHIRGRAGQQEARLRILRELVEAYPDHAALHLQLGSALMLSDPEAAPAVLRTALAAAAKPTLPQRLALADALNLTGQHEEALELLQAAIAEHGDTHLIRLALANAHLGLGRRDDWAAVLSGILPRQGTTPTVRIASQEDVPLLEAFQAEKLVACPEAAETPLVTVIMTAYNAEATIEPAMRSVLAQTYTRLRLVVVDDVSTDATLGRVRAVAAEDPRIIIMRQERNAGTYAAKNRALSIVHSDYYTFHDSDDWMHPCRLERHVAFMREHPEVVCSYSSWVRLDMSGRVVTHLQENPASSFFHRTLLQECGYFDNVRASADGEFRWRLRRRYGYPAVPLMDDILTIGTRREGSLTTGGDTAFDEYGFSPVRVAYAEAWGRWHRGVADDEALYMPYPLHKRLFDTPPEFACAAVPSDHPFRDRPASEEPSPDAITVQWPLGDAIVRNWGDKLNPELVVLLAERPVVNQTDSRRHRANPTHLVIGSGLASATSEKIVWGSGFIAHDDLLRHHPMKICAVRGPRSRERVLLTEPSCPEVYGDPALLYPIFYDPKIEPTYDIGLIQHCREAWEEPLPLLRAGLTVRLIDINGGLHEVIDAILSCRRILSSSLHGLIASHAYGVPATWLRFSDRPKGDGFKFKDYWASMGRDDVEPVQVIPGQGLDHEAGISTPGTVRVDLFSLLRACPFIDAARQEALVKLAESKRATAHPCSILNIHAGLGRMAEKAVDA